MWHWTVRIAGRIRNCSSLTGESYAGRRVAGCPPDAFSANGQLWGNPLYRWEYHRETGFDVVDTADEHIAMQLYDVVRVDHFRGFDAYYSIPYGAKTAAGGATGMKGPGMELFRALQKELGKAAIIAEDLGYLTDSVVQLVQRFGLSGNESD